MVKIYRDFSKSKEHISLVLGTAMTTTLPYDASKTWENAENRPQFYVVGRHCPHFNCPEGLWCVRFGKSYEKYSLWACEKKENSCNLGVECPPPFVECHSQATLERAISAITEIIPETTTPTTLQPPETNPGRSPWADCDYAIYQTIIVGLLVLIIVLALFWWNTNKVRLNFF